MVCITRDRLDGIGRVSRDRLQVPVEGAVTEEPRDILLDDARRVELRGLSVDRREAVSYTHLTLPTILRV